MTQNADVYLKAVQVFNETKSLDALFAVMDDSVVFHASTGADLNGTAEVKEALNALQKQMDWTGHEIFNWTESNGWMSLLFQNIYADGHKAMGGGILRFNDQGRLIEVWAHVVQP